VRDSPSRVEAHRETDLKTSGTTIHAALRKGEAPAMDRGGFVETNLVAAI
jgi:hypothetical protein